MSFKTVFNWLTTIPSRRADKLAFLSYLKNLQENLPNSFDIPLHKILKCILDYVYFAGNSILYSQHVHNNIDGNQTVEPMGPILMLPNVV